MALRTAALIRQNDRGKNLFEQIGIQNLALQFEGGSRSGLAEGLALKEGIERSLTSESFNDVHFYDVHFAQTPDIACSFITQPEVDFSNRRLQVLWGRDELDTIACSIFATERGGRAVFVWFRQHDPSCGALIDHLESLQEPEFTAAILRFTLEHCENTFMAPSWWEHLTDCERERLSRRLLGSPGVDAPNTLLDDGLRVANWSVMLRRRSETIETEPALLADIRD